MEECYRRSSHSSFPSRESAWCLEVRTPYSSWTFDRREGWDGARPCPQVPSGDLGLAPGAASGRARGEPGREEGGSGGGRPSLETLPFLSSHPWGTFPFLVSSPTICFFKTDLSSLTSSGDPCWKLRANVGGNMQLLPRLTQVPGGAKNRVETDPGPSPEAEAAV